MSPGITPQGREMSKRLGRNLVVARHRVRLSQESTASRASLHRTHVGLLEQGLRVPCLDTIVKVAGAVEVEPCDLLDGMEWGFETSRDIGPQARINPERTS